MKRFFISTMALLAMTGMAFAQPKPPTPKGINDQQIYHDAVQKTITVLQGGVTDATVALKFAQIANPEPDQAAIMCYNAVIVYMQGRADALASVVDVILPEPHLITLFQINRNVFKTVKGGIPTPIKIGCGGLAQDVGKDIIGLIAGMVGQAAVAAMTGLVVPIP